MVEAVGVSVFVRVKVGVAVGVIVAVGVDVCVDVAVFVAVGTFNVIVTGMAVAVPEESDSPDSLPVSISIKSGWSVFVFSFDVIVGAEMFSIYELNGSRKSADTLSLMTC